MSIDVSKRVWSESKQTGTHKLMLLAIADFADDAGRAFPSVPTLARMCGMRLRNAQTVLAALKRSGELHAQMNAGPHGANVHRLVFDQPAAPGANSGSGVQELAGVQTFAGVQKLARRGAKACAKPLQGFAPEPSENHQEPSEARKRASADPERSRRGSRLPADWTLPADWAAWALNERPDLDPKQTAARFADYWHAAPGSKGCKADWLATWRNWCRTERTGADARQATHRALPDTDHVFTADGAAA